MASRDRVPEVVAILVAADHNLTVDVAAGWIATDALPHAIMRNYEREAARTLMVFDYLMQLRDAAGGEGPTPQG